MKLYQRIKKLKQNAKKKNNIFIGKNHIIMRIKRLRQKIKSNHIKNKFFEAITVKKQQLEQF